MEFAVGFVLGVPFPFPCEDAVAVGVADGVADVDGVGDGDGLPWPSGFADGLPGGCDDRWDDWCEGCWPGGEVPGRVAVAQ